MDIAVRAFLLLAQFLCPLLFFTDLTRNPYVTQIAILNVSLLGAAAAYIWSQAKNSEWKLPRTPLDLPIACWLSLCMLTWTWAYFHHGAFFRPAMRAEGFRIMFFTIVNAVLPYYLSVSSSKDYPSQPAVSWIPWAIFAVVWGGLWALFPQLRAGAGPVMEIWPHAWDNYGGILWLVGLFVLARLMRGGSVHHYWHLALTAGFSSAVYGVCQYFNMELIWPKVLNPYGGRSVSTFGNPNFMSSYMVLLMPVAVVYYLKARTRGARLAYAAVFLAMEGSLLASLTRSSWIGALVALGMLGFSKELRRLARENLEAHGLIASLAVLMILFWPQSAVSGYTPSVFGRVRELGDAFNVRAAVPYSPLYQRVLIWSCAWLMGNENPILGKGWGLFELYYPFYQGHVLDLFHFFHTMRTHANNAHNEILEVWSQTGILGVGVLFWIWTTFFSAGLRWSRDREKRFRESEAPWMFAGLAGAAGMLADNLMNVSLHFAVPAFMFWWQVGTVMSRGADGAGEGRTARFPSRALSLSVVMAVVLSCAGGSWWWVKQWNREAHYFIGFKLLRSNQMARAIEELETAVRWHGREVNTDYELGNAYARSNEFPKAAWAYEDALKSNAGYDEIYLNLATVLSQHLGRSDEALKYFLVSHAINPISVDVYNALTAFYLRDPQRYRGDAVALLEQALTFHPDNANFLTNLGYLYRLGHDYAKAEDVLAQALRRDPEMQVAERSLADLSRESGRPPHPALREVAAYRDLEARIARKDYSPATLEIARKAVQWFPRGIKGRFYLGNLEMLNGHPEAALAALGPLQQIEPINAVLQRNLGEIYLRMGRNQEAIRAYQASLQADPGNAYVRQRLTQLGYAPPR